MKIVILDGYCLNPGDLSWDGFSAMGGVTVHDRTPVNDEEEITRRIGDSEIILTNKTPVTRAILDRCPAVRYVGLLSTGYNVVDTEAAREKKIPVCNVPGYGTASVAQLTIGLLLEICHRVGHHNQAVHEGRWSSSIDYCFWDGTLLELAGKTMGIVGYGSIGQAVGRIAEALGMTVIASGPHPWREGERPAPYVPLKELLAKSDVVSLHCPLYAAGVDVTETEPLPADSPLLTARNCVITPHIAWAPLEARQRLMDIAVGNLRAFLEGTPRNVVNL